VRCSLAVVEGMLPTIGEPNRILASLVASKTTDGELVGSGIAGGLF
jgi:hypothetical protein